MPPPSSRPEIAAQAAPLTDKLANAARLRDLQTQSASIRHKLYLVKRNFNTALAEGKKGNCVIPSQLEGRINARFKKIEEGTDRADLSIKEFARQLRAVDSHPQLMLGVAKAVNEIHGDMLHQIGDVIILVYGIKKEDRKGKTA